MADQQEDVYCTLLMSDSYLPGAMVLAHSLLDAGTKKKLAVLVLLENLQAATIAELRKVFDYIIPVEHIANKSPANLYLMNRPDLGSTFTKINLWRQEQFRKIIYVDADVVALRAPDELFNLPSKFAAASDIGWPDCFNSGVMVLNPNAQDYYGLLALAQRGISFDGADQGLLNMYFRSFDRMSFTYNCTPSGHYQYVPAYRHFQSSISMVHFIGPEKPWQLGNQSSNNSSPYDEMLGRWWAVYDRHYKVPASASISGLGEDETKTVRQYVKGETIEYGYTSTEAPAPAPGPAPEAQQPVQDSQEPSSPREPPPPEPAQSHPAPVFSAPLIDWDPARSAPPSHSKAEAEHFPTTSYTMSTDKAFFEAPQSYPSPPKDLYYEVPKQAPAGPKPIFPWEKNGTVRPTRVFAEDRPAPTSQQTSQTASSETATLLGTTSSPPSTPGSSSSATAAPTDPWQSYTRTNAWDENPDIERYVSSIAKARRGKIQVLLADNALPGGPDAKEVISGTDRERRPSVKLTDFPTEVERPSLPVTPAPIRRPSFWGAERDEEGLLPAAEGVPNQAEWNPASQLEELTRRSSLVLPEILDRDKNGETGPEIPDRKLPLSAVSELPAQKPASGSPGDEKIAASAVATETTTLSQPTPINPTEAPVDPLITAVAAERDA